MVFKSFLLRDFKKDVRLVKCILTANGLIRGEALGQSRPFLVKVHKLKCEICRPIRQIEINGCGAVICPHGDDTAGQDTDLCDISLRPCRRRSLVVRLLTYGRTSRWRHGGKVGHIDMKS